MGYERGEKKLKAEYESLTKIKACLVDNKKHIRFGEWNSNDIEVLNKHLFITAKPMIYLVNLSEKDFIRKKNKWLPKLMEMESEDEKKAYIEETKCTSSLNKIVVQGYK